MLYCVTLRCVTGATRPSDPTDRVVRQHRHGWSSIQSVPCPAVPSSRDIWLQQVYVHSQATVEVFEGRFYTGSQELQFVIVK